MTTVQLKALEDAGVVSFTVSQDGGFETMRPLKGFMIQALHCVSPLGEAHDWHPGAIARISFDQAFSSTIARDRKLTRFLIRHAHSSPLEMIRLSFLVRAPKFVMSQISRHRTIVSNSTSTRYKDTRKVDGVSYYVPPPELAGFAAKDVKQGRSLPDSQNAEHRRRAQDTHDAMAKAYADIEAAIAQLKSAGVAQEVARQLSPRASFSAKLLFVDWWNFSHFVAIRAAEHAELECQIVAEAMYRLAQRRLPLTEYLVGCRKQALQAASTFSTEEERDVIT